MYYGPPRRRRIRPRNLIILIAAIAAGSIFLLSYLGILPSFFFTGAVRELDTSLPDGVSANQHGILYNQNDTLHLMDKEGKEVWSLGLEIADATTITSEELIVSYADKSISVLKFNNKEPMFSTSLSTDILMAAAGNNAVAVLTNSPSEEGKPQYYVSLFNLSGEQISLIDSFTDRQVLRFGFYGDADMFWVLSLDSSGITPISSISTFKTDGSITANVTISSEIVEQVHVTDNTIYASGTNTLSSHSYFGVKNTEQSIYGWQPEAQSVQAQSIKMAYAPRSKATEIDTARIYSSDLQYVHVRLPRNVFELAVTQNKLYAFTEQTVYVYTMDGTLERQISLDKPMVRARQLSDTCAVLWDNQRSYIMELS